MGKVTKLSTSVEAMPGVSVITVTVGAVKSGKTSMGAWSAVCQPQTEHAKAQTKTTARLRSDQRMKKSIFFSP
jgi:hypothetical protein